MDFFKKKRIHSLELEKRDLEKWRKLYADNDQNWNYWNKDYYDLVINTYSHNAEETLQHALNPIGYKPD